MYQNSQLFIPLYLAFPVLLWHKIKKQLKSQYIYAVFLELEYQIQWIGGIVIAKLLLVLKPKSLIVIWPLHQQNFHVVYITYR